VDRQSYEGDDVSVRAQPWIAHEASGVVVIEVEVTVKTILHRRTGQWLKPEQQQGYPPIRLRPQPCVRIAGTVLAVVRPLSGEARKAPPAGGRSHGQHSSPLQTAHRAGTPRLGLVHTRPAPGRSGRP